MSKSKIDLTQGDIRRQLIAFAVPLLLSNLLQSLYSLVDTVIVSRFIGEGGLAAVNSGGQIMTVLISVIIGLCLGGSVVAGQFFGAGEQEKLEQTIGTFFSVILLFAAVLTAVFLLWAETFLRAVNTPEDVLHQAAVFLRTYCVAIPFLFGYNAIAAVLRGMGNSRTALWIVAATALCNVVLDLLFVVWLGWGVAGAAAATTISIILSFVLALRYFMGQQDVFRFRAANFRIQKELAAKCLWIGFPSALQQSVFGLSILIMTGFVNRYGVLAAAALGIGYRVDQFAVQPIYAISNAETSMVAQNLGAGRIDRVQQAVVRTVELELCLVVLLVAAFQLFPVQIVSIFTDVPELIALGTLYLRYISIDFFFVALVRTFNSLAVGVGNSFFPLMVTIMNGFIFRIPIALFCERVLNMGLSGIFLGLGLANLGGATAGFIYYKKKFWVPRKRNI